MKKVLILGIASLIFMCMFFSACNSSNTISQETEAQTEVQTEAPTEPEIDFEKSISNCKRNFGTYGYGEEKNANNGIFDDFTVSSDGKSMSISCDNSWAITLKHVSTAVRCMNNELGFSDSLYDKMSMTRAIDGIQTDENDKIKVSWSYHPDSGLSVIYEKK